MDWIKKKGSLVMVLVLLFSEAVEAQTWSEWFSQKKTQKKYLLEQLAALKLYAGYLKKGYEIGSAGLNFIKDAAHGEFELHGAFFNSLKAVNPEISKNGMLIEIIQIQVSISKIFASLAKEQRLGTEDEKYLDRVRNNMLNECLSDMEELFLIVTSEKIALTDAERLMRLSHLYDDMQQKRNFAMSFAESVHTLISLRETDLKTIRTLEGWYEGN